MEISSEVKIKELVIHKIAEEGLFASNNAICNLDEDLNSLLVKYFFKTFKIEERFHFSHPEGLEHNAIFKILNELFKDPSKLFDHSLDIAGLLSSQSTHHNIKEGDFLVAYFEDCIIGDEVTDAVGLFKVENKDTFIKIMGEGADFQISQDEGISINKLDKGVIIFNTEAENGYQALLVDNTNKAGNAQYWQEDFLGLEKDVDEYFQTQNLINNLQEFAQTEFEGNEPAEKIAFVNQSLDYLKHNNHFDKDDYQEKVLQSPELIDNFENFQERKQEDNPDLQIAGFDISKPAVQNTKRFIKSIIKLDKNFHVYVHGRKDKIVRGFDPEKKLNYYTLYFDEET
ncbi:MAG: nucleoid-associated protein [Reichenbachiella sp.]